MSTKLNVLFLFIVILFVNTTDHNYFPEEITPLDYISNTADEKLLIAYYFVKPEDASALSNYSKKYDFLNGIIVYPFNDVSIYLISVLIILVIIVVPDLRYYLLIVII